MSLSDGRGEIILSSSKKMSKAGFKGAKIAVIAHLFYEDLFGYCIGYLMNIPQYIDIYIATDTKEKGDAIDNACSNLEMKNYSIRIVNNKGREISALLIGCRDILEDYEYICFVHDKKTSGGCGPQKYGQTDMYIIWENMLKSTIYIENIIGYLEDNREVGLLVPPAPYHANYFANYGNEWRACFERTRHLAEELHLKSNIKKENPPLTIETAFWSRTLALKALYKYKFSYDLFEDEPLSLDSSFNHAVERVFGYVAEHEGYTTQIVMNEKFAGLQLNNYRHIINNIVDRKSGYLCFDTYEQLLNGGRK